MNLTKHLKLDGCGSLVNINNYFLIVNFAKIN